ESPGGFASSPEVDRSKNEVLNGFGESFFNAVRGIVGYEPSSSLLARPDFSIIGALFLGQFRIPDVVRVLMGENELSGAVAKASTQRDGRPPVSAPRLIVAVDHRVGTLLALVIPHQQVHVD